METSFPTDMGYMPFQLKLLFSPIHFLNVVSYFYLFNPYVKRGLIFRSNHAFLV
jgi:hypothetical protein